MENDANQSNFINEKISKIVYLDFDGVLHDDAVYWHPKKGIYLATPGRKLFEWMYILEDLMNPYPDVRIVLSTSWVRAKSYGYARLQLSQNLRERVIGATFHNREMQKIEFDLTSRGVQVWNDVLRRKPSDWIAIDNDENGWPSHCRSNLILTHDRLGLSDPKIQSEVATALRSMNKMQERIWADANSTSKNGVILHKILPPLRVLLQSLSTNQPKFPQTTLQTWQDSEEA